MKTDPPTEPIANAIMEILETLLDSPGNLERAAHLVQLAAEIGYPLWQLDPTGANSVWLGALSHYFFRLDAAIQNGWAQAEVEAQVDRIHAHLQTANAFGSPPHYTPVIHNHS